MAGRLEEAARLLQDQIGRDIERAPLERINDVYTRLKRGDMEGRAVITPAA